MTLHNNESQEKQELYVRLNLQQADHVHHVQEVVICQHEACSSKNGKGVKKTPLSGEYMNNKINVQQDALPEIKSINAKQHGDTK